MLAKTEKDEERGVNPKLGAVTGASRKADGLEGIRLFSFERSDSPVLLRVDDRADHGNRRYDEDGDGDGLRNGSVN